MTATYLAEAIRAVAADPTPDRLRELRSLAAQVGRMEVFLDNLVQDSAGEAAALRRAKARMAYEQNDR